jgi:hypothetical protein
MAAPFGDGRASPPCPTRACNGTLVKVERGLVGVRDRVRHKTIEVAAGHSYFARVPRAKRP